MHELERASRRIARLVGVVEPGAHADRDVQRVLELELARRRLAQDPAQVLAVHVLHREEVLAVLEADVVDGGDVRVIERRDEARLVEQHPDEALVRGLVPEDALQRDELRESADPVDAREEQLRHPAGAQRSDQHVPPQAHR